MSKMAKTEEPMPAAKRKAAPPPPPAELKKSRKSQIIDQGGVPPLPVGIIRPKDGQPPKPEQPKPDRALHLVISLKPAPVPEAASSSGHVKGDGKGGSKTGHWSSMEQADLQQMLSIKDESESKMARFKAREEAVVACADSSREQVEKALERLAIINAPKEKTKKGMGLGKVACTGNCGRMMKWSLMDNVQVWDVDPSTIPEEELIEVDVHWHWDRFCWECRAKEWGCTLEEAQERILSKGGYSDGKRLRVKEFQEAVQNVQEFFEMALALQDEVITPKQRRQCESIARQSLLKVFKDMSGVIRKRRIADEMQAADMAEQKHLIGLLSTEVDADLRAELIHRIDVLNSKPQVFIGFADQPVEESVKADLWVVSTFQDEFSSGGPGSDNYLRFYFVCQATHGNYPRCFTMYTSKGWRRKYETLEWRKGQAYYCDCNAKYNHNWGCLVEFSIDGVLYYMRAPVPDARTLDMLAVKAEETFYQPGMSAADLFNKLRSVPPQSSTFVRMVNGNKDVMKITDPEFFDSLEVFPWSQIMNMAPQ